MCYLNLHKNFIEIFFGHFLDMARSQLFWSEHFCREKIIKKFKKANKPLPIGLIFTSISDVLPELREIYYYFNHSFFFDPAQLNTFGREHFYKEKNIEKLIFSTFFQKWNCFKNI